MIKSSNGLDLVNRFLTESKAGSEYVRYGRYMDIYIRRRPAIVLANITIYSKKQKGRGIFTRFLDEIEPHFTVHVENVLNPRLHGYLTRRGYLPYANDWEGNPFSYKKLLT